MKDFPQLPQHPSLYLDAFTNSLILEETNYNKDEMDKEFSSLFHNLNDEQREVYNTVVNSVDNNLGSQFFVYGSGGWGKTYLWRTLIYKLRSLGNILLPVASSGILLLFFQMVGQHIQGLRYLLFLMIIHCAVSHIIQMLLNFLGAQVSLFGMKPQCNIVMHLNALIDL